MPWKGEKDPYKIWLSEIILQQTRVEQGLTYYEKFIKQFPSVTKLAEARDEEVFKLWEGLGYYSRCRNLLATARIVAHEKMGKFPTDFGEILKLKGIGTYTASAISSFAYGLPYAVLDGNVYRVLSRYFGKKTPIDVPEGKRDFEKLARELLFVEDTARYNQAIMDFGATVCKPQLPDCKDCVLQENCVAFKKGWVNKLPIKEKKIEKRSRWFYYFIFQYKDKFLVNQRKGKDIWQSLHDFYLHETTQTEVWTNEKASSFLRKIGVNGYIIRSISKVYSQQLTHQDIRGQFILVELQEVPPALSHLQQVMGEKLQSLAFPKFINQHLADMMQ